MHGVSIPISLAAIIPKLHGSYWEFFEKSSSYHTDITIGFGSPSYSISKSQGHVQLQVKILDGKLGQPVSVLISTIDGSATGLSVWSVVT